MIDPKEWESLKRLRRQRAAELKADDDGEVANWRKAQEFARDLESKDTEAFNVESDEQEGHFDDEGYFLFNDRQKRSECDVLKAKRDAKKRKLGIDDEEKFIAMKSQKNRLTKFQDKEKPSDNEYTDDEAPDATAKDSWLAEIDEGRAGFKSQEDIQKLLKAKEEEKSKIEARLDARYGTDMSDEDRLQSLIDLLPNDQDTPAALLVNIKQRAQQEDHSMLSRKEQLKRKKGFQRPVKLNEDQKKAMNKITELCDALVLNGVQVYEESKRQLQEKLRQMRERDGKGREETWELKRPAASETTLMSVKEARRYLEQLTPEEQRAVRCRQVTADGGTMSSLWLPGDMMDYGTND